MDVGVGPVVPAWVEACECAGVGTLPPLTPKAVGDEGEGTRGGEEGKVIAGLSLFFLSLSFSLSIFHFLFFPVFFSFGFFNFFCFHLVYNLFLYFISSFLVLFFLFFLFFLS